MHAPRILGRGIRYLYHSYDVTAIRNKLILICFNFYRTSLEPALLLFTEYYTDELIEMRDRLQLLVGMTQSQTNN